VAAHFTEPDLDSVRALLSAMVGRRITVIGDLMLDEYVFGRVTRTSVEAPVPIVAVEQEERLLGGAANVARCLVALGARVRLCGVVGADTDARLLLDEARALRIDVRGVVADPARPTTLKRRVVAQRQQMVRLDRESVEPLGAQAARRLAPRALKCVRWADGVVLSDYAKGVLQPPLCRAVLRAAGTRPVVVDPKEPPWGQYRSATVFKPNSRAAAHYVGRELRTEADAASAARRILADLSVAHVLLTRGEHGPTLASRPARRGEAPAVLHLPARRHEVADTTGAGDVVCAAAALALASGADAPAAAWLANLAAGVKVGKFGAAAVAEHELLEALGHPHLACERKVLSRAQAAALAARLRRQGRRVVFTNGCFDILHFGHVSLLERARRLGDALIVGVNTDASVRRLKGPGRPVQPQRDRARVLAAQACVDAVVLFAEDTPRELIGALRPDVLCKGADYRRRENVVGWDLVEGWGGQVVLVPLEKDRSTSRILSRLPQE
jgi:D-beta-D-heptose 7-phosphate kinase/D-beta-D-heptose 1-phosphate adenosyltransferase